MKINDLLKLTQDLASRGYGNCRVAFDTEARRFNVHLVEVSDGHMSPPEEISGTEECLVLRPNWDEVLSTVE